MKSTTKTALAGALLAGMLMACSTTPATKAPPQTAIRGTAEQAINLDTQGRPLSVVVRLYQLRDYVDFSTLTFEAIASGRPEESLLGPQLIRKQEWIAVPSSEFASPLTLDPETRYVAVAALFRQPNAQYWRYLVAADALRTEGTLKVHVGPCYLVVQSPKPLQMPGQSPGAAPSCAQGASASRLPAARNERPGAAVSPGASQPAAARSADPNAGKVASTATAPAAAAIPGFAAPVGSAKALPAQIVQQEAPGVIEKLWNRVLPTATK